MENKNEIMEVVSIPKFAKIYKFSKEYAYKLVELEDFPKVKIGKRKWVMLSDVPDWFRKHQGEQLF